MIETNPTTGLPELPEGHSWWVSTHDIHILKALPDTEWVETAPYYHDGPADRTEEPRGREFYLREQRQETVMKDHRFWSAFGIKVKTPTEVRQVRYTQRRLTVKSRFGLLAVGQSKRRGESPDMSKVEELGPNTKANLLERAQEVLDAFNADQESKEISGHYPPKTFGETA